MWLSVPVVSPVRYLSVYLLRLYLNWALSKASPRRALSRRRAGANQQKGPTAPPGFAQDVNGMRVADDSLCRSTFPGTASLT